MMWHFQKCQYKICGIKKIGINTYIHIWSSTGICFRALNPSYSLFCWWLHHFSTRGNWTTLSKMNEHETKQVLPAKSRQEKSSLLMLSSLNPCSHHNGFRAGWLTAAAATAAAEVLFFLALGFACRSSLISSLQFVVAACSLSWWRRPTDTSSCTSVCFSGWMIM